MMVWSKGAAGGDITVTVPDRAALLADIGQRFEARQGFTVAPRCMPESHDFLAVVLKVVF